MGSGHNYSIAIAFKARNARYSIQLRTNIIEGKAKVKRSRRDAASTHQVFSIRMDHVIGCTGVHETIEHLELFLHNLLLGEENELKNRFLHVDWGDEDGQCVKSQDPKSQIDTLECTLEECEHEVSCS